MFNVSIDLTQLAQALSTLERDFSLRPHKKVLSEDFAYFYKRQPIPVDTGRLRRALSRKTASERRVYATDTHAKIVIYVPYAQYQLPKLQHYQGETLPGRLAAKIQADLARRSREAGGDE